MIELLVVLLIISILAGLSYALLGRTGTSARIAATRTTLQQLDSLINERMEAFRRHDFRNQAAFLKYGYDAAGNTPSVVPFQAAERMVRKDRFRAAFPSRYEDLFGLDGVDGDAAGNFDRTDGLAASDFSDFGLGDDAPLATLIAGLVTTGQYNPAADDPATESIELLYLALTRGPTYGSPLDSLDGIDADRLMDTDGDGLIEILDDWGNPIRFYNWPTALMRAGAGFDTFDPGAANALVSDRPPGTVDWTDVVDYTNALKQDPDDPFGELSVYFATYDLDFGSGANPMAGFGQTDPMDTTTEQALNDITSTGINTFHFSNTWHRPLLVSMGPNEELGLGEPNAPNASRFAFADLNADGVIDTNEIEALGDNITNRQQAGGN